MGRRRGVSALHLDGSVLRRLGAAGFVGPLAESSAPWLGASDVVSALLVLLVPTTAVACWAAVRGVADAVLAVLSRQRARSWLAGAVRCGLALALLSLLTETYRGYIPLPPPWAVAVHRRLPWVWPVRPTLFRLHLQICAAACVLAAFACVSMRVVFAPLLVVDASDSDWNATRSQRAARRAQRIAARVAAREGKKHR